ncbi:unnamed protein product [Hymenolepis diminuta]|uniref:BHLH domain-containing protein n=1 Tax=Hymenolepis diminuta TaxID=6216 RepID=A0A0R3SQB1_HYMDI|nr:unnamed protein product [Hymenolepis diminuta]
MHRENAVIGSARFHRRSLSTQSNCNIIGLPDYSSKSPSPYTASSINNQAIYRINDQIPRTANNHQHLPGTIRIIDRRNRFKQMEREPRCSSVPIRVSSGRKNRVKEDINGSPKPNIRGLLSWNGAEEDSVSSRKNSLARVKRNIQTLRDRVFPSLSQDVLNGKPPPYSSANNLEFYQERWQVTTFQL